MISQQYTKKPFFNDRLSEILYGSAEDILSKQSYIAKTFLARRSGNLIRNLSGRNFNIISSTQRVNLLIDYVSTIRFLDLKKTSKGKLKRNYTPIYNKILYGFLYSKTYPALRYGMAENIRDNFVGTLRAGLNTN